VLTLVHLPKLDASRPAPGSARWTRLWRHGARRPGGARNALPQWIAQRLAAQGQRVEAGEEGQRTLQFFADRVEGNLLAAHQEIQKLGLLHPGRPLSFEQVEAAVLNVARYDVFKLARRCWPARRRAALRMLDGLQAEGEAEVLVHYTLAEDIRALKRVKDAMGDGRRCPWRCASSASGA
jgi:DNA polymerase-3 subunit delta